MSSVIETGECNVYPIAVNPTKDDKQEIAKQATATPEQSKEQVNQQAGKKQKSGSNAKIDTITEHFESQDIEGDSIKSEREPLKSNKRQDL